MNLNIKNSITIFGFEIYFYALIIVSGMILGAVVASILAKRRGLNPEIIIDYLLAIIPLSIIGARLYYVLFSLSEFNSFFDVINIRDGGLAIYGGIIGGAIGVAIVGRIKKVPFLQFADIAVAALILGQAIGRWGNFVNQEAYGNIVLNPKYFGLPFSVFIESKNAYFQATFFYESMWNLLGFALLFVAAWFYRKKPDGVIMCAYFVWYGIGRLVIEGLRSDSLYIANTQIRVSQALSAVLILAGILFAITLIFIYKRKHKGK